MNISFGNIHLDLDIDFLIRLKDTTFNKEIGRQMTSDGQIIRISLNNNITKTISNDKLIWKRNICWFKSHKIRNNSTKRQTLHWNINIYIFHGWFHKRRLKTFIWLKMDNRNWLWHLKNILELENFTGQRRIIIEQDLYS